MVFTIPCPACRSNEEKQIINQYYYDQTAKYFCPPSRDKSRSERYANAVKRLWKQDIGYFLRCKVCDFGFGYPFIGGDDEFYDIVHEQSDYPKNRWEYDLTIDEFFTKTPVLKILDIGAGGGFFLDKVKCPQKFAMEGSETNRTLLKEKGYHVFRDDNGLIEKNQGSFNYITMFHVLEHISEFENILYSANYLLGVQGTLIISVPDCDAMILQEKLTGYPDIFPNHINKWTPHSLELVLNKFGFKKEEVIYEQASIRKFFDSVHLKISHQATKNRTFASNIYKIKNKKIRIIFLLLYSLSIIPSLIPYYKKLSGRGSFLLRAVKINPALKEVID
jgi:2-polyprenyl-3-methyl-5-hydroxy-6-metoxy-1,4-benzoquinol methylase